MFWDKVACVYDVFANVINRKANRTLCETVAALIRPALPMAPETLLVVPLSVRFI